MKKMIKRFNVAVHYDAKKRGAHYTMDFVHYGNGGDAAEWVTKDAFGLDATKDANGAYDMTDDIPEYNASVKSSAATLVNKPLGDDFNSTMTAYFETVHSKVIWYSVADFAKKIVIIYEMNHAEFSEYLKHFSRFDASRKVIRLNKDATSKNLHWLERKSRI
jgi:hypothetical protein